MTNPTREYLEDVQDGDRRENTFKKTQTEPVAAARKAKREIADERAMSGDGGEYVPDPLPLGGGVNGYIGSEGRSHKQNIYSHKIQLDFATIARESGRVGF